jgi:hypothetical protein
MAPETAGYWRFMALSYFKFDKSNFLPFQAILDTFHFFSSKKITQPQPHGQRWKKGWKLGRNFPERIMVGRKFSASERCFDMI